MWTLAAIGVGMAVQALIAESWLVAAGAACGTLFLGGLGWTGLSAAGLDSPKLARRIVECDDSRGRGIRVPNRMASPLVLSVSLCGGAVYALVASLGYYSGLSSSLLPSGREANSSATLLGIVGLVALVSGLCVGLLSPRGEVRIYPSGIRRLTRRLSMFKSTTLDTYRSWEEIEIVCADEEIVHSGAVDVHHPVIKLGTFDPINLKERTKFDTERALALMARTYVAEPHTFLELLRRLHEQPDLRSDVGRPGARELLRPPALRTRLKSGRKEKNVDGSES
ncbi:hypothetical protein [Rhodococcus sp. W8901]|uniref:hypothetical protein n=1 Tax=Rhodococcus sp. W8901 TaxID=2742603 RepID=UPI00158355C2|nr:hypothetical protein [Rhodococcus sp. W8901]QKT10954.1 hypothetical protein HUN07_09725 [Rhodococcus sp. W8901]